MLRRTATVTAGGAKAASRSVKLGKRSVSDVTIRFSAAGVSAVRAAGGRATLKLALARAPRTTARRTMTLGLPGATRGYRRAHSGQGPSPGGTSPAAAALDRGRPPGSEGAYDDLEFTLIDGKITITKTRLVPVYCFEIGAGHYHNTLSFEPFVLAGPWTSAARGRPAVGHLR